MKEMNYTTRIFQQLLGKAITKDDAEIEQWRSSAKENDDLYSEIEKIVAGSKNYQTDYQPNVEKGLTQLKHRILESKKQAHVEKFAARRRFMRVAAAVLFLLVSVTIGQWFVGTKSVKILTQAEAKTIELEDGSIVHLNENSQIEYAANFGACNRKLQLQGEAFFEVAENADCPFVVETSQTTVTVLGTAFNVRAQPSATQTEIMVMSGKVTVESNKSGQKTTLLPNEKVIHAHGQSLTKTTDKDYHSVAWHTLDFRKESVKVIAQAMEKKYKVRIDLSKTAIQDCKYTLDLNKNTLANALAALQISFDLTMEEVENNAFILKGGYENCSNVQ